MATGGTRNRYARDAATTLCERNQPEGILFLDELTAAAQRLRIRACSLILDRRIGNYVLPDGWQVVGGRQRQFLWRTQPPHRAALADRLFQVDIGMCIGALLQYS